MTEIEKAKTLWRICGNMAIYLSVSDRAQIANSFKAMIELAEQAEGFEAFKREVSDAIQSCMLGPVAEERLSPFILPKPVDPLVDAIQEADEVETGWSRASDYAEHLRAALAKSGLEVRAIEK